MTSLELVSGTEKLTRVSHLLRLIMGLYVTTKYDRTSTCKEVNLFTQKPGKILKPCLPPLMPCLGTQSDPSIKLGIAGGRLGCYLISSFVQMNWAGHGVPRVKHYL